MEASSGTSAGVQAPAASTSRRARKVPLLLHTCTKPWLPPLPLLLLLLPVLLPLPLKDGSTCQLVTFAPNTSRAPCACASRSWAAMQRSGASTPPSCSYSDLDSGGRR